MIEKVFDNEIEGKESGSEENAQDALFTRLSLMIPYLNGSGE